MILIVADLEQKSIDRLARASSCYPTTHSMYHAITNGWNLPSYKVANLIEMQIESHKIANMNDRMTVF